MLHLLVFFMLMICFNCSSNRSQNEIKRSDLGLLENSQITEASGIDASVINKDVFWTHNDSGDKSRIFAIDKNGRDRGTFWIEGITARDWEDITIGPGPQSNRSYIYIADIGDNKAKYEVKYIYRIEEPRLNKKINPAVPAILKAETIQFRYPDGQRDAEALLIDPLSKDLYVISKREENVRVYRLPFPQKTDDIIIAEYVISLKLTQITAGDISASGREIILKNYDQIFFWQKNSNQSFKDIFDDPPLLLPYIIEPQGEGLCWSNDGKGYFTLSEEAKGEEARLYFYPYPSLK